jgi:predicted acylesterase/phospholipase RssA
MNDAAMIRRMLMTAFGLLLAGCVTPARIEPPAEPASAFIDGMPGMARLNAADPETVDAVFGLLAEAQAAADDSFDILALSGGGARGAFSAGLLAGLTLADNRPEYEIVTGVSAGALAAPFAFLGPEWDPQLSAAFSDPGSRALLSFRGPGALFGPGVYSAKPLRERVDAFVTMDLIDAVARESRRGRLLLVQTTDLDAQSAVLWNLGKIAEISGQPARRLFKDVLLASASVPGVFPPVIFDVVQNGERRQEMHVDGGVVSSFVLTPLVAATWRKDATPAILPARFYLILNGPLSSQVETTPRNTIPIISRSFESSQLHQARMSIAIAAEFAARRDMDFQFAFIPPGFDDTGVLDLTQQEMAALFEKASAYAKKNDIWQRADELIESGVLAPWTALTPSASSQTGDAKAVEQTAKEVTN